MPTITAKITAKGRKYFKILSSGKYVGKLVICPECESWDVGETHTFDAIDKSRRSKYGTEIIYEISMAEAEDQRGRVVTLSHDRYNEDLVEKCRELGGKWDRGEKVWVFPALVEDQVEELDFIYNSDLVAVEIKFPSGAGEYGGSVTVAGYPVATAYGRDSGAKLGEGISLIEGRAISGGSVKNWATRITEGAIIRMEIPRELLRNLADDGRIEYREI